MVLVGYMQWLAHPLPTNTTLIEFDPLIKDRFSTVYFSRVHSVAYFQKVWSLKDSHERILIRMWKMHITVECLEYTQSNTVPVIIEN